MGVVTTTNQNVQTANRIIIYFGGTAVGLMQSCRLSDSFGLETVYQVGDIDPVENVPTRASYRLAVSQYVFKTTTLRSLGLIPENGAASLQGLVFNIQVSSKDTGSVLRAYLGASYDSGDIDVRAGAIVGENSNWMCLGTQGTGL